MCSVFFVCSKGKRLKELDPTNVKTMLRRGSANVALGKPDAAKEGACYLLCVGGGWVLCGPCALCVGVGGCVMFGKKGKGEERGGGGGHDCRKGGERMLAPAHSNRRTGVCTQAQTPSHFHVA